MLASIEVAPVAQGIEHWFPEPGVVGSNPAGGTRIYNRTGGGSNSNG